MRHRHTLTQLPRLTTTPRLSCEVRVVTVLAYRVVGRLEILSMKLGTVPGISPCSILATSIPVSLRESIRGLPQQSSHTGPGQGIFLHGRRADGAGSVLGLDGEGVDFVGSLKDQNESTKSNHCGILGKRGRCKHRNWMNIYHVAQSHSKASGGAW